MDTAFLIRLRFEGRSSSPRVVVDYTESQMRHPLISHLMIAQIDSLAQQRLRCSDLNKRQLKQ